jgi:hypothetical protein
MIDEATNQGSGGERVGFCQDCGRPLTRETVRTVGSGVFCEPCLEARLTGSSQAGGATQGPGVPPPAGGPIPPPPASSGEPSPLLAGLLGLIPGVGAMYNGQVAKGFAHLVVFAVLVFLSDHVSDLFGWFVAGWIVYQAFEAYHTAKARRDGLPLPDPFGFNDIGDRMGFGKNWPGSTSRPTATPPDWVGYVPPTQFGSAAAQQATATEEVRQQAYGDAAPGTPPPPADSQQTSASWGSTHYHAPYTAPYVPPTTESTIPSAPIVSARRFPVGAIWLIVLGLIFLLANVNSSLFHLNGRWILPLLLAGLSVWIFIRRLGWAGGVSRLAKNGQEDEFAFAQFICILRAPVMFMVLAIIFALQAGHVMTLGQTWPVLVIAFGAVLLLERSVGRPRYIPPANFMPGTPQPAGYTPTYTASPSEPRAPQWSATDDSAKGGQ